MKQYEVYYTLTFQSSIVIEAKNKEEAKKMVEEMQWDEISGYIDPGFVEIEASAIEEK